MRPARTCAKVLARPSRAPRRMEKGPVRGSCRGHVGEVDCGVASYLLGLGPSADDRLGGVAGRGGDVVSLDTEVQATAVGHHVVVEAGDSRVNF